MDIYRDCGTAGSRFAETRRTGGGGEELLQRARKCVGESRYGKESRRATDFDHGPMRADACSRLTADLRHRPTTEAGRNRAARLDT